MTLQKNNINECIEIKCKYVVHELRERAREKYRLYLETGLFSWKDDSCQRLIMKNCRLERCYYYVLGGGNGIEKGRWFQFKQSQMYGESEPERISFKKVFDNLSEDTQREIIFLLELFV